MFQGNESPWRLLKNKNSRFPSWVASQSGAGPQSRRREPGEASASMAGQVYQPVEKPPGVRGPQPPEAIIGFGGVYGKSAKSLA